MQQAAKETERYLEGNAVFELDEDGSFEATLSSDCGVRYFSGFDAERASRATCRSLDNQIKRAYDAMEPSQALKTIAAIWDVAEKTCELAAARSRCFWGNCQSLSLLQFPYGLMKLLEHG